MYIVLDLTHSDTQLTGDVLISIAWSSHKLNIAPLIAGQMRGVFIRDRILARYSNGIQNQLGGVSSRSRSRSSSSSSNSRIHIGRIVKYAVQLGIYSRVPKFGIHRGSSRFDCMYLLVGEE